VDDDPLSEKERQLTQCCTTLGNASEVPNLSDFGTSKLRQREGAAVREHTTAARNERDNKRAIMKAAKQFDRWNALLSDTLLAR
jgi:hypothetical protein